MAATKEEGQAGRKVDSDRKVREREGGIWPYSAFPLHTVSLRTCQATAPEEKDMPPNKKPKNQGSLQYSAS
jgi:hypothetical protein